jgi:hypothetical protein
MPLTFQGIIFIPLALCLFIIGKRTVQELYTILKLFFRNDYVVFAIIALIFLPGTLFHELAHYVMAIMLFLHVTDFTIVPRWYKSDITLGRVTYYKRDVIRSILVGVAPLLAGILFFLGIAYFHVFPQASQGYIYNAVFIYLIFVISTSMYSSKQDLVDIAYIIPVLFIIFILAYFLNGNIAAIVEKLYIGGVVEYLFRTLNYYLAISLAIHVVLIVCIRSMLRLFRH